MGKKIVLLEFEDEAESFLGYCKNNSLAPESFSIIALQPKVQVFLKKHGIPHENTLPYFSPGSHARLLLKSEEWVRFLAKRLNLLDGTEIKETYNDTFLFFTRFYMHHFLMCTEIISSIYEKGGVDSFHAFVYKNEYSPHDPPHIRDSERFSGLIAKKFSESRKIPFRELPAVKIPEAKASKSGSPAMPLEKYMSDFLKFLWTSDIKDSKVILLASSGYNIGKLARNLRSHVPECKWVLISDKKPSWCTASFLAEKFSRVTGFPKTNSLLDARLPVLPVDDAESESYRMLEKSIDDFTGKLETEWLSEFNYKDVNFIELMSGKIKEDLKFYLLKLHQESVAVKGILERLNVKLLISPFARERSLMLAELCRHRGIPALMISHGTLVEPRNELEEIEYYHMGVSLNLSKFYNYTAIQTPLQEKHFLHYNSGNTPVRTGNLIYSKIDPDRREELRRKIVGEANAGKKIIVYPENVRDRFNTRFHVFETFDEFLSSSADLVNAVNEIRDAHLVLRLHPGRKLTPEEFRLLLPESDNLTIDTPETPFSAILTIADLMVNFSSTVVEDALQNDIPVLLYDKTGRYMHVDSQKLGKGIAPKPNAVYYVDDASYLKDGLRWILDNHVNADVPKSVFNKYVYKEDYHSNLIDFISSVCLKKVEEK